MEAGKSGFLGELNSATDFQSTIAEFSRPDGFHKVWDFATIVSDHRGAQVKIPALLGASARVTGFTPTLRCMTSAMTRWSFRPASTSS